MTDPSRYRVPEGAPKPIVGDYEQRRDNIKAALEQGLSEIRDQTGRLIGWGNSREDLLLDAEHRKLLDILNHDPSREEVLANMIRRECRDMSPEAQFELAKMDKNIRVDVIRKMLIPEEPDTVKEVAIDEETPEPPKKRVTPRREVINRAVEETHETISKKAADIGIQLPFGDEPGPILIPTESDVQEKLVQMSCAIGRYQMPVLDVIVEDAYAIIVQRQDASFLFLPERDRKRYTLSVCEYPMEFSGVAFEYDHQRFTLMILKK